MRTTALVLLLAAVLGAAPQEKKKGKGKATEPKAAATTLRGCVDQAQNGNFILTGNRELDKIITLHGAGFADENFAKHLGHTVNVTGRLESGAEPVMRVTKVQHVSELCIPEERKQK